MFGGIRGRPGRRGDMADGLGDFLRQASMLTGIHVGNSPIAIDPDMTFREWCESLVKDGLKVDGHPFTLANRPALHFLYDQIPTTIEDGFDRMFVLMKCAQVGFTVMEMLAAVYMAIKFAPAKCGLYLPDMTLAGAKSTHRFMPLLRTIKSAYKLLREANNGQEGNVLIRKLGESSLLYFLWTSGKAMTESFPMDALLFDEVQEMSVGDMEKTMERMSASRLRYTLMGSTANMPDSDIEAWYKRGTMHEFHTRCSACGKLSVLDKAFPGCIKFNRNNKVPGAPADDYCYTCPAEVGTGPTGAPVLCGAYIPDTQAGEWIPAAPGRPITSAHFSQLLSPTITAGQLLLKYQNAEDIKNFHNRALGRVYTDPSQVPVTLPMLEAAMAAGIAAGVEWLRSAARGTTYMGIDQMGLFNVVLICRRRLDGRMELIHAEEIYSKDPFVRCSEMMDQYGVAVCVVESLPNYNDAQRFAGRHEGRVFLASYSDLRDDMMLWGDANVTKAERRTSDEDRTRYTVVLQQYKVMQVAMKRISKGLVLFPDSKLLVQEIREKGIAALKEVLRDRVWYHFLHTALIVDVDEEERKSKSRVVKVGIDPHFSYAWMLMNVAWARAYGTGTFILPTGEPERPDIAKTLPGISEEVIHMFRQRPESGMVCGRCSAWDPAKTWCNDRGFLAQAKDPACGLFDAVEQ